MKKNETGIFQKENGNWYYRFTIMKDGKKHEYKRNTDENGCKLTSQKAAIKAKVVAMKKAREELERIKKPLARKTFTEVYAEYVERGRNGKAYQTIRKQDSLWDNHIKERFGARFVDEVSVAEINDLCCGEPIRFSFLENIIIHQISSQCLILFLSTFFLFCHGITAFRYFNYTILMCIFQYNVRIFHCNSLQNDKNVI